MGLFGSRKERQLREIPALVADRSYAALAQMLADRDPEVRAAAVDALAACGEEARHATIYPTLKSTDTETLEAAGRALRGMGERAVWEVFEADLGGEIPDASMIAVAEMGAAAEKPLRAIALGQGNWGNAVRSRMANDSAARDLSEQDVPRLVDEARGHARTLALGAIKTMMLMDQPITPMTLRVIATIAATADVAEQYATKDKGGFRFEVPARDVSHYALMLSDREAAVERLLEGRYSAGDPIAPLPPLYPDDAFLGVLARDIVERAASAPA